MALPGGGGERKVETGGEGGGNAPVVRQASSKRRTGCGPAQRRYTGVSGETEGSGGGGECLPAWPRVPEAPLAEPVADVVRGRHHGAAQKVAKGGLWRSNGAVAS